jgi:cytochrome c-type biogenesis protein
MVMQGIQSLLQDRPLAALPAVFAAGLATSFTPCIYPMIPITAGILAGGGAGGRSRPRALAASLLYALGLALVYSTLGLLAGLTGTIFGGVSSSPWAYLVMGNLLLAAALALLDVFTVQAPGRLLAWAGRIGGGSLTGAFAMGATSGLVAAPCGAPVFAAVLTFVGATGSGALGFTYLFVFSLGMTALLVVVGASAGSLAALPKAGRWTLLVKRAAGVVLLGMAEYYFVQMGKVL